MPIYMTVRRNFVVPALLEIEDQAFAHWYELGVWWAMYGDGQGHGRYPDTYLIDTILSGMKHGWYDTPSSGWFPMVGFKLGMVHGGYITEPANTLVVLTDYEFTRGYHVGRDYHFTEAIPEGRILTDILFNEVVHAWARDFASWHEPVSVFSYCLGCRIGELSGATIPAAVPVTKPVMRV